VSTPRQELFYLTHLHFWKKTFLIYTEGFIVTFPCMYVLYPKLVQPLHFSYDLSVSKDLLISLCWSLKVKGLFSIF
jgi:hypothetical protein